MREIDTDVTDPGSGALTNRDEIMVTHHSGVLDARRILKLTACEFF
jgi:hypothetical protein